MSENNTPEYQIITQESAPLFFRNFFDKIESRYTRRSRYIKDISQLMHEMEHLCMNSDYRAYVDSSGHIMIRVE